MHDHPPVGEHTVAVMENRGGDGPPELVLTIENAIEDRVRAYSRLMRMKQVLKKTRTSDERLTGIQPRSSR